MQGIIGAVGECERDEGTEAILLTSSNKSIFCGGLELQEMVDKDEGCVLKYKCLQSDKSSKMCPIAFIGLG